MSYVANFPSLTNRKSAINFPRNNRITLISSKILWFREFNFNLWRFFNFPLFYSLIISSSFFVFRSLLFFLSSISIHKSFPFLLLLDIFCKFSFFCVCNFVIYSFIYSFTMFVWLDVANLLPFLFIYAPLLGLLLCFHLLIFLLLFWPCCFLKRHLLVWLEIIKMFPQNFNLSLWFFLCFCNFFFFCVTFYVFMTIKLI